MHWALILFSASLGRYPGSYYQRFQPGASGSREGGEEDLDCAARGCGPKACIAAEQGSKRGAARSAACSLQPLPRP